MAWAPEKTSRVATRAVRSPEPRRCHPAGRKIRTLVNGMQSNGHYKIKWNGKSEAGSEVASGVYVYRLQSNNNVAIKKMIFLK